MEIQFPNMPDPVSSYTPKGGKSTMALWDGNQMRGYMAEGIILNIGQISGFQFRVDPWLTLCFGDTIKYDTKERNYRFGEEALELTQSLGMTKEEAHQLVEYVFNRPVGEPKQEVGGTMVTLAALCIASNIDMMLEGERELTRINQPEMVERIRTKNANKPKFGPLPGSVE